MISIAATAMAVAVQQAAVIGVVRDSTDLERLRHRSFGAGRARARRSSWTECGSSTRSMWADSWRPSTPRPSIA